MQWCVIGSLNITYPYGVRECKVNSINKASGEKWMSVILKATNNGLWQQLHLFAVELSDIKVISISSILLTVLLCTTLKPNGKLFGNFVWLDMGLTNSEKESNQSWTASNFVPPNVLSGPLFLRRGGLGLPKAKSWWHTVCQSRGSLHRLWILRPQSNIHPFPGKPIN